MPALFKINPRIAYTYDDDEKLKVY